VSLAVAGVGFAASYGYAPGVVPASIRRGVDALATDVDPGLALLAVGAVTGVLALLFAWVSEGHDTPTATATATEGDRPERRVAVAGEDLTRRYERVVAGEETDARSEPIRDRLRAVVIDAHRTAGRERAAAVEVVDDGAWTDDRYAAAFLTSTSAVDYPLRHRLYAWLYPDRAYERRVHRTLRAVEGCCATRVTGVEAPSPERGWWHRVRATLEGSS
jgi:hypothetical protein